MWNPISTPLLATDGLAGEWKSPFNTCPWGNHVAKILTNFGTAIFFSVFLLLAYVSHVFASCKNTVPIHQQFWNLRKLAYVLFGLECQEQSHANVLIVRENKEVAGLGRIIVVEWAVLSLSFLRWNSQFPLRKLPVSYVVTHSLLRAKCVRLPLKRNKRTAFYWTVLKFRKLCFVMP